MFAPSLCCRWLVVAFVLLAVGRATAVEPGEILPAGDYDPEIPTPREYLGFEIGSRHIRHHELIGYLKAVAAASSRVTGHQYARSYGDRPLMLFEITSSANQKKLASIRAAHRRLADSAAARDEADLDRLPAVMNMGYCVHGNESSAANAVPLVAYWLAAGRGAKHEALLDNVVVLLDPCLNPDGFSRFAAWANNHRGQQLNSDPNHREHREPWPSGRTNYYWFDLNRDWLPAQHPESQGRLTEYHQWKPNVVLDFHEMGTDATYFFQPGVPLRNHPLTPDRTFQLTRQFARFHADALDRAGSLYYTEERFDDFYMGKGSTYPDLHGAVGILFEQASSRGHVQDSIHGRLTFAFTIRNQFLTSLSSLRAAHALRRELLEHKRTFYRDALALARSGPVKGYLVAAPYDPARLHRFLTLLHRHDIRSYRLAETTDLAGRTYRAGAAYVIPAEQPEFRFLQAVFETRTKFAENIFYDVSTWTLPLAFHLQYNSLAQRPAKAWLGEAFDPDRPPLERLRTSGRDLAYLIDWRGYFAPRTVQRLLAADVRVYVARQPLQVAAGPEAESFGPGTVLVPLGIQPDKREQVRRILERAGGDAVRVVPVSSGLTPRGIDLGSSEFVPVPQPKVLLVIGGGASSYEAGEVWHLLDRRFEIPVTLVDAHRLSSVDLHKYTTIVVVSRVDSVSSGGIEKVKRFVAEGGKLIAIGTAARWVAEQKLAVVDFREPAAAAGSDATPATRRRRPYGEATRDAAFQLVRGSIFHTQVDPTHPIGYGFSRDVPLPVFRNNRVVLEIAADPYNTPVAYLKDPLLSGYISPSNLDQLRSAASIVVHDRGRGRVILMPDNPNFRAFWHGTQRLFLNAVLF